MGSVQRGAGSKEGGIQKGKRIGVSSKTLQPKVEEPTALPVERKLAPVPKKLVDPPRGDSRPWEQTTATERAEAPMSEAYGEAAVAAVGRTKRKRRKILDQEAEWRGTGAPVWWLGGAVICMLSIGIGVTWKIRSGEKGSPVVASREPTIFTPSGNIESLPIADFVLDSGDLLPVVREILNAVETGAGGAELLRDGEASMDRMKEWRERVPAPAPFGDNGHHEIHASAIRDFGYLLMTGDRSDFSRLMAYFVREEGVLLLDWEATEGYSEVALGEVASLPGGEDRMMRVVFGTSNFFTEQYPEGEYRCYTLHQRDPGEWLWAYVPLGSPADRSLITQLNFRDPLGRGRRATIKIGKGVEGSRPNQVEITEFLFGDWIDPRLSDRDEVSED